MKPWRREVITFVRKILPSLESDNLKEICKIERRLKMRLYSSKSLILVVFLGITLVLGGISSAADPDPKKVSAVLKAGGGAVGGIGFMVMTGMSKVVKEAYPKIDITVVPGGWVGNLFRVQKGELDIGSTTTAMCALADAKRAPFDKPIPKVKALYSTQDRLYYFAIVRKDLEVNTLAELFKKKPPVRLCIIQKGTTTELMWRNVFESQGVKWEDISKWGGKMNFVAWADAVNLVKDAHADGILAVGVRKIGWAMDLTNTRPMKILKWDPELLGMLKKRFGFGMDSIPGNTYPGITQDVNCPTDSGAAVINAGVKADVVKAILAALANNAQVYSKHHAALTNFKAKGMAESLKLPLHPAALEFYKARGIPTP
jgi:TRAP transporter TAXI family solute receptor